LSDASEQDVLQPTSADSDDGSSADDIDDQSIDETSDSVDDAVGDDLIFDDSQMDDFMDMV